MPPKKNSVENPVPAGEKQEEWDKWLEGEGLGQKKKMSEIDEENLRIVDDSSSLAGGVRDYLNSRRFGTRSEIATDPEHEKVRKALANKYGVSESQVQELMSDYDGRVSEL